MEDVVVGSYGFDIHWSDPGFKDDNYIILSSSNARLSGAMTGVGGNNDEDDEDTHKVTPIKTQLQTRPITKHTFVNTDYVSVVAGYPPVSWRYVVFNGQECDGDGSHGKICTVDSSNGVLEVEREATGRYTVWWSNESEFEDFVIISYNIHSLMKFEERIEWLLRELGDRRWDVIVFTET